MPPSFVTVFVIAWFSLLAPGNASVQSNENLWTRPVAPLRIVGNIHYVGSADLSSFLITTPDGHILVETGAAAYADTLLANIKTLGFKPEDVRLILTTQAHFDHVGAHAAVQKATGAQVVVAEGDASVVEDGGKGDFHFGPEYYFSPVKVNRVVRDGDVVRLGGVELRAHLTPGHTKGCTSWTMAVREADGVERHVLFAGSTSVNPGVQLVKNAKYPTIAADYQRAFKVLRSLECDYCLTAHLSAMDGLAKLDALRKGASPNPFLNAGEFRASVEQSERRFQAELARQKEK